MRISPCRNCPKRETGCHARCSDYGDWRKEKDEENKRIREGKARLDCTYNANAVKEMFRKQRRKRK